MPAFPPLLLAAALPDDEVWITFAIVTGAVALAIHLEQTQRWAARLSGPVLALLFGLASTELGVVSPRSPVFAAIGAYAVPICIPLLLLRANLRAILRSAGSLFFVFHLAALGTMLGALIAHFALRAGVPDTPELAGIMTGSYIGGSVNFSSLSQAYGPQMDRSVLGPLVVADNLVMAAVFFVCFLLPSSRWLKRRFRTPHEDELARTASSSAGAPSESAAARHWAPKPISLAHIAIVLAIAVAIAGTSQSIAEAARAAALPQLALLLLNPFLVTTVLCVALATFAEAPLQKLGGDQELGTWLIYLFFFAIGTEASIAELVQQGSAMFVFCAILALSNVLVALALGKLFRCHLEEIALAINATLGGAPSAAAMAIAKGWSGLVLPAVLVGVWGYILGQGCGIAIAEFLLAWERGGI
ncbi:MAG: DUF819 family protein [Planctomycetes bacterium]|nr:DUF819 family protein [Planctomycetota bacterium]